MQHPLQGCRVQLESARRYLDRDAVIAADQGDAFAAGSAVAVEVWGGHENNLSVSGSRVLISVHASVLNSFGPQDMWTHVAVSMEVSS